MWQNIYYIPTVVTQLPSTVPNLALADKLMSAARLQEIRAYFPAPDLLSIPTTRKYNLQAIQDPLIECFHQAQIRTRLESCLSNVDILSRDFHCEAEQKDLDVEVA